MTNRARGLARRNAIFFVAILSAASIWGCADGDSVVAEPKLRPVKVVTVTENGGARRRTFSGISRSTQESRLSFKVGGTVVSLPIQPGDRLKSGALIATLDRSTFDLQVQQSQASLLQAQASQRNADANYERVRGLYENSNASRNDLDRARADAESAGAQVRAAEKAHEIDRLNRSYTRLTATGDCTVAAVAVEINENVDAGTEIARVNCGSGIEVNLSVPESLIAGFSPGLNGSVRFSVVPDRLYSAQVTEIGIASGSSGSTFPVSVRITDADDAVRPSLAAEVTFEFGSTSDSRIHVLPAAAVVNDERGTFVFVAEPVAGGSTATIRRRNVTIGELTQEGIEISSGIEPGDLVVTAGISVIRDQQIVLVP